MDGQKPADPSTDDDSRATDDSPETDDSRAMDEHLADVEDGCGCTEVWEHLSERRDDD